jgi:hypothetical protein
VFVLADVILPQAEILPGDDPIFPPIAGIEVKLPMRIWSKLGNALPAAMW